MNAYQIIFYMYQFNTKLSARIMEHVKFNILFFLYKTSRHNLEY